MSIGAISFPGFTNSHTISNKKMFYQCGKAVNVIGSLSGNTINDADVIAPSQIDKNVNGDIIRYVYTGSTTYYFLLETSEKAFAIEVENTGGSAISSVIVYESVSGYNWDGYNGGANLLSASITANNNWILRVPRGQYPNGIQWLMKITCGSDTLVSIQGR